MKELGKGGIDLIKEFEGCVLKVYKDSAGLPTIGIGHLIKPGEKFTTLTQKQAEDLLKKDLKQFVDAVNKLVQVDINQDQFDALVAFCFNVGAGALGSSTLLKRLNAKLYDQAADQFLVWNKAKVNGVSTVIKGLSRRRQAERALFLKAQICPVS